MPSPAKHLPPEKLVLFLQSRGHINAAQALEIAGQFSPKFLSKHEFLLREGKVCDDYFFLDRGLLRAFAHNPAGNEVTTAFYPSGQTVLEVSSFFNRIPSQENIQALTDCAGWVVPFAQLNALFHARPEFREFGRSVLVQGFAALKNRMLDMITATATERYEQLLRNSPEVLQHAPVKHIATYLGVTDTSLSRIRAGAKGVGKE
ncbi:Crp/Fnr family transcriptional regulator [Hymenobacter monticola]|uniref:Crp/Fnr family transcriptional regulator n=1 Tax=Hymenobacter monticola TaxID=1705399 RepID=A0ABY4B9D7_9BACT|nr:Crp/Fnr family transcriptional regulator [Hymenobacter monticola]UOE33250.1 Crp/Fnr family transcriptional regulator [Hymenobacter monticola]